ncbi:unnamed protein product [Rhizoctonia solani]|uniref:Protein kinase domain-containing protein n=1 Tax=Rhizoctonia solani TaxID=456999 RepID=A0A8H3E425_9AGAM|nr:unnamed protein product [Rhizoctonia solani]
MFLEYRHVVCQLWLHLLELLQSTLQNAFAILQRSVNSWELDELRGEQEVLAHPPVASPSRTEVITSEMKSECVATCLVQHGCDDITSALDLRHCQHHPFARGGFGVVYQGVLKDGRRVAIKCIESFGGHMSPHGKNLKRSAREIYMWSRCNHQGILPMLGFAHFRGQIALISPWMEAGSLRQHILGGLLVPPLQTCAQLATAVEYMHTNGIVHGDIKPVTSTHLAPTFVVAEARSQDNVLLTDQGQVQLADFGSAISTLATTLNFTQTSSFHFTTRFAAPEVLKEDNHTFTKEGDIYALGMTIYSVLAGQIPFADKWEASVIIEVVYKKGQPSRPDFARSLQGDAAKAKMWDLLQRCFAYEPGDRPTAIKVKEDLLEVEKLNSVPGWEIGVAFDRND